MFVRQPFAKARANLFVSQGFATLDLRQPLLDLAHEPVVGFSEALNVAGSSGTEPLGFGFAFIHGSSGTVARVRDLHD